MITKPEPKKSDKAEKPKPPEFPCVECGAPSTHWKPGESDKPIYYCAAHPSQ